MARDNRSKPLRNPEDAQQQEEMTVVVMRFKGSGESLQKGFDAVSQAIAALGVPQPPMQQRVFAPPRPPVQLPAGPVIEGQVQNGDGEYIEEEADAPEAPAAKPPKAPRVGKPYTFMNDFVLAPEGVPSLTDYCAEKNPQTVDQKFLVASAWAQKYGGADPFTGGHLFTCFRAMGWKTQVDMTQPLRKLKSDKSYYENTSFGKWKLTGIGLSAAENIGKEKE